PLQLLDGRAKAYVNSMTYNSDTRNVVVNDQVLTMNGEPPVGIGEFLMIGNPAILWMMRWIAPVRVSSFPPAGRLGFIHSIIYLCDSHPVLCNNGTFKFPLAVVADKAYKHIELGLFGFEYVFEKFLPFEIANFLEVESH